MSTQDPLEDTPLLAELVREGRRQAVEDARRRLGGAHRMEPPRGGQPEAMPDTEPDDRTCPHGLHFGGFYCEDCNP